MRRLLIALFLALIRQNVAVAEDVVRFDPATGAYQGCSSIGDSRVWLMDHNDVMTPKPGFLYAEQGCGAVLPGVADRYQKVKAGQVVEMTQAEQDTVDQPAKDAAIARQALLDEQAQLEAAVDAAYATATWANLTAAERIAVMRKGMRLNRVYRLLGER